MPNPPITRKTKPQDQLARNTKIREASFEHRTGKTKDELTTQLQQNWTMKSANLSESMAARQVRVSERMAEQLALLKATREAGKANLYDAEDVWNQAQTYMEACIEKGHPPSMMEFAACLGYTWRGAQYWMTQHPNTKSAEIWGILRDMWTALRNDLASEKVLDTIMSIYLSNNSGTGLTNNPGEVAEKQDTISDYKSADEVKRKYQNLDE